MNYCEAKGKWGEKEERIGGEQEARRVGREEGERGRERGEKRGKTREGRGGRFQLGFQDTQGEESKRGR